MIVLLLCCLFHSLHASWLSADVIHQMIDRFKKEEAIRSQISFKGPDRRTSTPFITGNGFRANSSIVCDESNACRIHPEHIRDGICVFVKTDFFEFFVKNVVNRATGSYKLISHNGDLSAPDGQSDAPRIGMPKYITSDLLEKEYESGRLIAHHGQNLWWTNVTARPRPAFTHCLPIGLENRQYPVGKYPEVYVEAWIRNIINQPPLSFSQASSLPLLLVAFYPKSRVPDRKNVLTKLHHSQSEIDPTTGQPVGKWYNETDLDHIGWLDGVRHHRFVLAPFGHGLDTHRVSEILLMGGVPVMRRSSISSCYDDSDNEYVERVVVVGGGGSSSLSGAGGAGAERRHTRGSLPVVILDSWDELTRERLEKEWARLGPLLGTVQWDWRRLFMDQWLERVGC